jgi:hypothetical protein
MLISWANHSQWVSGCLADFTRLIPPWKQDSFRIADHHGKIPVATLTSVPNLARLAVGRPGSLKYQARYGIITQSLLAHVCLARCGVVVACPERAALQSATSISGSFLCSDSVVSGDFGDGRLASDSTGNGRIQSVKKDQGHSPRVFKPFGCFRFSTGSSCLFLPVFSTE